MLSPSTQPAEDESMFFQRYLQILYSLGMTIILRTFCLALLLALSLGIAVDRLDSALPSKLIAGEIHYSRIPVEYWQHRLLTVKSMGFNALSVYIMWNYHQISKGVFDYQTQNKNLKLFLQLAQKYGFYVMIRPGPYVCAEWDFGGMPARLLNIPEISLRANNFPFLGQVYEYFKSLAPILQPFLSSNGGPIVLLQIQNQYGFYGQDKSYIETLRQMWWSLNIKTNEYYVDTAVNLDKCHWTGANIGINDGISEQQYIYAKILEPNGMIFGGQIYSGWLTHWGEDYQDKNMTQYKKEFTFLFENNHSFSMYMVHGGSNFGLTAGANTKDPKKKRGDYEADITTYDYGAPINEQGSPNQKFYAFRELAIRYVDWDVPAVPSPKLAIIIPAFKPYKIADLLANLPAPTISQSSTLFPFESSQLQMYNQGFVVYETALAAKSYQFTMTIHDFAVVYLDSICIGSFDRSVSPSHVFNASCTKSSCKLTIIVEAMGHINFDHGMQTDFKGLIDFSDKASSKFIWNIYKINIDKDILNWRKIGDKSFPSLAKATFNVTTIGDTYLNVKNYQKGYLWVNGRNLGRYWNVGPSFKLFCPGVWLKQGLNELYILDLLTDELSDIKGEQFLN